MDIENADELTAYLRVTGRVGAAEALAIKNLAGGVSNRTVWVQRESGETWVLKQALAKLRVAVDWFSDPRRVDREALGIEWLNKLTASADGEATDEASHFGRVPALIFHDSAEHLLAMQAVPEPHVNFKTALLAGEVNLGHVSQLAELLARIHGQAYLRSAELPVAFRDRQYFANLRLEPYYRYTAQQVPEAAGFLNSLIASTNLRKITLVHGDYSPKNVLVYNDRLVLLDHEVIHWGDPAFDLGFALTHLLSKALHLPEQRSQVLLAAHLFFTYYLKGLVDQGIHEKWVLETETWAVRHTLGCLLARVSGRSQLEYLTAEEKERQRAAAVSLMPSPPATVESLVLKFGVRI